MHHPPLDWEKGEIRTITLLPAQLDDESLSCSFEVIPSRAPQIDSGTESIGNPEINSNDDSWNSLWSHASDKPESLSSTVADNDDSGDFTSDHYIALSYQWGKKTEVILVNGRPLAVPKNLVDALKAIRSKRAAINGVRVWADSICIDQGNKNDLNRHLPEMKEIYRNANEVVVWLGKEDENSKLAIDLLHSLAKTSSDQDVDALMDQCLKSQAHFPPGSWLALYNFMKRDYWSRLWIIQELCMAKPSSPLLCGDEAISWETLYTALWKVLGKHLDAVVKLIDRDHIEFRNSPFVQGHTDLLRRGFIYHINLEQTLQSGSTVGLSQRNKENTKDSWHIQPMLDRARVAAVSRNHDKVYGLMGMLPNAVMDLLVPDYDSSVNDCFVSLASSWIAGTGDLEILSQCTSSRDPELPSWAPDWRVSQHVRLFPGANSPYKASSSLKASTVLSTNGRILTARGVLIDKIDGLGSRSASGTNGIEGVKQSQFRTNAYASTEGLREALWRTLVGNITTSGHPAKAEYGNLLRVLQVGLDSSRTTQQSEESVRVQHFNNFVGESAELLLAGRELRWYFESSLPLDADKMANLCPPSALEQAYRFCQLKRLATTELGYLAMVVDEALPGDIICVLLGSDVPIVLRHTADGSYEVVGACYVHGVMHGEAVEGNGERFGRLRDFTIV